MGGGEVGGVGRVFYLWVVKGEMEWVGWGLRNVREESGV